MSVPVYTVIGGAGLSSDDEIRIRSEMTRISKLVRVAVMAAGWWWWCQWLSVSSADPAFIGAPIRSDGTAVINETDTETAIIFVGCGAQYPVVLDAKPPASRPIANDAMVGIWADL